jgi:hypothetical protein
MIMNLRTNFIQICHVEDKDASYLVDLNKKLNHKVVIVNNNYMIAFCTEMVWRSPDAEFSKIPSGTYVFKNGDLYFSED